MHDIPEWRKAPKVFIVSIVDTGLDFDLDGDGDESIRCTIFGQNIPLDVYEIEVDDGPYDGQRFFVGQKWIDRYYPEE